MIEQNEVEKRIEGLDMQTAKSVVCALVGHSRIVTTCFGYVDCARCEAQIGDTIAGAGSTKDNVVVGHACDVCRANFAKCTWKDTFLCQDPFDPAEIEAQERGRAMIAVLREKYK